MFDSKLTLPGTAVTDLGVQPKWGWACRMLDRAAVWRVAPLDAPAQVGDVLVGRVTAVRHHARLMDPHGARVRLYEGDVLVGVAGHRYATDAFDADAEISGEDADLLTNAGMLGRVRRRHAGVGAPSQLRIVGRLADGQDSPVNLIKTGFRARPRPGGQPRVVLVVGSGMNAGKTTTAVKLTRGLRQRRLKVAALKVTGSVSPNDRSELLATGAEYVRDFSDYGFPSTHRLDPAVLEDLVGTMLADAFDVRPDVVVVEIADGVLQTETQALLRCSWLRELAHGAVVAAGCSLSALKSIEVVGDAGLCVLGISGVVTNAPLFVDELARHTSTPVLSSADDGAALAQAVAPRCVVRDFAA